MLSNLTPNGEDTILEPGGLAHPGTPNALNNQVDNLDTRLVEILQKFESAPKFTHDNSLKITYDEAKVQLKTLIAEQVVAGRIDELARIDGFAYGTDYGDYQIKRIQELQALKDKQGE